MQMAEDSDAVPEFRKISGSIRTPQQIVAYAGTADDIYKAAGR